jgi:hypothetical protein
MGTICFESDKDAGGILQDELCGETSAIRMFTTCGDSAAVAMSVDLAKASEGWRAHILETYDLPGNASRAIVGVVVKHTGLNGSGRRSISLKTMTEDMGPYYTGGANKQLLSILSPLRPGVCPWAEQWRERAWRNA